MKANKKLVTGIISIMLCAVLCFGFIITRTDTTGVETLSAATRTVELTSLSTYDNYICDFEEKNLSYDESNVSFHGLMGYSKDSCDLFDLVSESDINEEEMNITYDCSFNKDTMQFTFKATLLNELGEIIDEEEIITDAFITEYGGLDAYIELDGQTYLLSDYISTNVLDNCGLFGWLVAAIVVVVVYIIVAETAEQIRARENYSYNQQLESDGNGVYKNYYITSQKESSRVGYKAANYRFGFTTFDGVGCEVAAAYNLLIALGKGEMLSKTIYDFETSLLEFAIGWGKLGSDPLDIGRCFLDRKGISYSQYNTYACFKSDLSKKTNCKVIFSVWNNGGMLKSIFSGEGLHTYYFEKRSSSDFRAYNLRGSSSAEYYSSIDSIYNQGGYIIVAYIIK